MTTDTLTGVFMCNGRDRKIKTGFKVIFHSDYIEVRTFIVLCCCVDVSQRAELKYIYI